MHHLTDENFNQIQEFLNDNYSLIEIAKLLEKDPRAISRHIKKYRIFATSGKNSNRCFNIRVCNQIKLCKNLHCRNGKCKFCSFQNCNELCDKYLTTPVCKRLRKFPFVCNGCPSKNSCISPKFYYRASNTITTARKQLIETRSHIHFSREELLKIDKIVAPLIKQGLSIEVILLKEKSIDISVASLYKIIELRLLPSLINLDLKRKVRYKKAHKKGTKSFSEPDFLVGRGYEDFVKIIASSSNSNVWEIDTVEGIKGWKAIMTLLHRTTNLMLMFLIENVESSEIVRIFNVIKEKCGDVIFKASFRIILGDNGKEFKSPSLIETSNITGEKLVNYFYCEPRQSQQKGKIEKNHEFIRERYPKGTSFDDLSQKDINFLSLNINNYPRPKLNGHTPIEFASISLNKKILEINELVQIDFKDVKLK